MAEPSVLSEPLPGPSLRFPHAHTRAHRLAAIHAHSHRFSHMRTRMRAQLYAHARVRARACTCDKGRLKHAHAQVHARAHTHATTSRAKHIRTHTHTHTHGYTSAARRPFDRSQRYTKRVAPVRWTRVALTSHSTHHRMQRAITQHRRVRLVKWPVKLHALRMQRSIDSARRGSHVNQRQPIAERRADRRRRSERADAALLAGRRAAAA